MIEIRAAIHLYPASNMPGIGHILDRAVETQCNVVVTPYADGDNVGLMVGAIGPFASDLIFHTVLRGFDERFIPFGDEEDQRIRAVVKPSEPITSLLTWLRSETRVKWCATVMMAGTPTEAVAILTSGPEVTNALVEILEELSGCPVRKEFPPGALDA